MKLKNKQITVLAVASLFFIACQAQATSLGFADVPLANYVGSGSNTSGLVIDFNDESATERYIFAYQWNGVAGDVSGAEMLDAVATAIPALSYSLGGGTIADGAFFTTISYGSQSETNGDFVTNFDYWGYFVAGGLAGDTMPSEAGGTSVSIPGAGSVIPDLVSGSPSGASALAFGDLGRFLADGSWDVWSFGPYEETYVVPEPSSFALVGGIVAMFALVRRRRVR
jgi:hypothetical protein